MMEVGRTRSFSKRLIRLLFPALVSPVKNKDEVSVILNKNIKRSMEKKINKVVVEDLRCLYIFA